MPQLYLIVVVLGILIGKLKDLFAGITIPDSAKQIIKFVLWGALFYYLYKIITHYVNKQNALGDENGSLAVELNNALYSQATKVHVPFFGDYHIGNGDEAAVLAISLRIKDITQVSAFYKDLFDTDLYVDLARVLNTEELAQFNKNIAGVKDGNLPNTKDVQNPKKPPVIATPLTQVTKLNVPLFCNSTSKVNLRSAKDPNTILYTVDKNSFGEVGKPNGYVGSFVKRRTEKVNGQSKPIVFIEVDIPFINQGFSWGLNGLIAETYLTTTAPK